MGPMVIMIYRYIFYTYSVEMLLSKLTSPRMLAQDLVRFGMIYSMFIMGFSQAYYVIFSGFESDEDDNPLETPVESFIQMFIMSLGEFGDLWDTFDSTKHSALGSIWKRNVPTLPTVSKMSFCSESSVVHIHVSSCDPAAEPLDCHDGRHLRQDCRDKERVDETVGQNGPHDREINLTQRETQAAKPVIRKEFKI